jgi:hypothetical protein
MKHCPYHCYTHGSKCKHWNPESDGGAGGFELVLGESLGDNINSDEVMQFENNNSSTEFNSVTGNTGDSSPLSSFTATFLAQQTDQYCCDLKYPAVKPPRSSPTNDSDDIALAMTLEPKDVAMVKIKKSQKLSPRRIRLLLAEILDDEQISIFFARYAHVNDKARVLFFAYSTKFESLGL